MCTKNEEYFVVWNMMIETQTMHLHSKPNSLYNLNASVNLCMRKSCLLYFPEEIVLKLRNVIMTKSTSRSVQASASLKDADRDCPNC